MAIENGAPTPPYVSFKTFQGFIESLMKGGLPQQIDNSTMEKLSGRNKGEVKAAMRFLKLITDEGTPTDLLHELTNGNDETIRGQAWQKMLVGAYPTLLGADTEGFDIARATLDQFRKKFRQTGLSNESIIKAERFFLAAAEQCGTVISTYITDAKRSSGRVVTPRSPRPKGAATPEEVANPEYSPQPSMETRRGWKETMLENLLGKFPEFNPDWDEEAQRRWLETYGNMLNLIQDEESDEE